MMHTENVIIPAGKSRRLEQSGKWFRARKMTGGTTPLVQLQAVTPQGKLLADGLNVYDGDLFGWDDYTFRDLVFSNATASDIAFEVLISDAGRHEIARIAIDNFPAVGGSDLPATVDKVIPFGAAVTLVAAANLSRRSIKVSSKLTNAPGAVPLRLASQGTVAANAGDELGVGGSQTYDVTCAIYAVNPDGALNQTVTITELLN